MTWRERRTHEQLRRRDGVRSYDNHDGMTWHGVQYVEPERLGERVKRWLVVAGVWALVIVVALLAGEVLQ